MLDTVTATQFNRVMNVGRNSPLLLECVRADGSFVEVVTKLSNSECGVGGLLCEAWSSVLAADLALPVPEPFVVSIQNDFIESLEDAQVKARLTQCDPCAFGSQLVTEGYSAWNEGMPVSKMLMESAADIFCFDALILNADRLPRNPNCLCNGKGFLIFDHDLAFRGLEVLGTFLQPYPWTAHAQQTLITGNGAHLFACALRHSQQQLIRLQEAWRTIAPERLVEYAGAMPASWTTVSDISDRIHSYLSELADNFVAGFEEVRRVLS